MTESDNLPRREGKIGGDSEKQFVWLHLDAYVDGTGLEGAVRQQFDEILSRRPDLRACVEAESLFHDAVRRTMKNPLAECPAGLRDRVIRALDVCEAEVGHPGALAEASMNRRRLSWRFAPFIAAAASILLVLGVVYAFQSPGPMPPVADLPSSLRPVVQSVSLDVEAHSDCNFEAANEEYRRHFETGPALPNKFGDAMYRVVDFRCIELDGRRYMATVYDTGDGNTFALLTFKRSCMARAMPDLMHSADMMVDGRLVLLWEEGEFLRAMIAQSGFNKLYKHRDSLR
jgi:hypothetical protein